MLVNLLINLDINMSMCIFFFFFFFEKTGQPNTAYEIRLTGSFCSDTIFKDFEIFVEKCGLVDLKMALS